MKKIFTMLCGALLMALALSAQDLVINKLPDGTAPVIDGTVDAVWDLIAEVPIELDDDEDYGITTVYDCYFKMTWNDTAFFLLMHRTDDDFANQWETTLQDWQSDRDEIFLDVNVDTLADGRGASNSQGDGTGADYGHYQFTSLWVKDADEWSGNPQQWYHNAPFQFGYKFVDADEYFTEYCFPFSSLTINTSLLPSADATFQGGADVVFGLVITIADVDMADSPTDESFRKFMRWVDEGGWASMDTAGHVLMSSTVLSGIEESTETSGIFAYPSPATNTINITNLNKATTALIFDITGTEVMRIEQLEDNTTLDISKLHSGSYFIRVNDATLKFIKK